MKRQPARILLDFGYVLSGPQDVSVFDPILAELGLDLETFLAAWGLHRRDYDGGLLDEAEYWSRTLLACGRADPSVGADGRLDALVEADFAAWSRPRPALHKLLGDLLDEGAELGILSNMPRGRGGRYVEAWPWLARIPHRLFSGEEGLTKPDPAIYELFLERSGWKAESTLFVDDSALNVAAAAGLGFAVHHFVGEDEAIAAIGAWARRG